MTGKTQRGGKKRIGETEKQEDTQGHGFKIKQKMQQKDGEL